MADIGRLSVGGNEIWWLRDGDSGHGDQPLAAEAVAASLRGTFKFAEAGEGVPGLRAPQLGALHAILAYRSVENVEPITIVMPTGTGKTETMLAAFCYAPGRTLVVVPTDALRSQIAEKFATLGILPAVGAITGQFRSPVVLVVSSGLINPEDVVDAAGRANVIVATAQAIARFSDAAKTRLSELCERLYVDEAHHVAAPTWQVVTELFATKEVVQFTATPYREDGRHLGGRIAYTYPLRLAQQHGLFARINYESVVDFVDPDRAVAAAAVGRLRADLAAGHDHLLMARVSSVARAREVLELYEELAADLHPRRIDTGLAESTQAQAKQALMNRSSRIVVCVNMLGEGFDLPALKVAAIHDPQKSLGVTLQFIGRFTRIGDATLGEASAFVPLRVAGLDERLRKLYGEDADWNHVVRDLTEHAVGAERERSDFEAAFSSVPREVAMRSIQPKMSTVIYRSTETLLWDPERVYELFEDRLLTSTIGINNRDRVAWWVSEEKVPVRWGDFASFNEVVHHLHVVHVDETGGFLYINSTNNDSLHEDIAKAVGGEAVELLRGNQVFRILSRVSRRVPTNVGLLDAVSRARRFSLHVGQDVLAAWTGEGGTKMKTNIFAHGFTDGRAVSFGASRKGRVWSHEQARDIHDWVRWTAPVGPTIVDESISLESVMSGFLLPEPATVRPPYIPLSIEWSHEITATLSDARQLEHAGSRYPFIEAELRLLGHDAAGPLTFEVVTPGWSLEYEFVFRADEPPLFRPLGEDGIVSTPNAHINLSAFLAQHGLLVSFADEIALVEQGFLLRPRRDRRLFPQEAIEVINWNNIDIRRESQGIHRDPTSIQYRSIEVLSAEEEWEVVIDDDGTGELADIVLMRRTDEDLVVLFAHCKYSSQPNPGARIDDLYDVCGQAMKMNRAKSVPELLTKRLLRREMDRQAKGLSGLVVGTPRLLNAIVGEARARTLQASVAVIQPGVSKALVSDDMRSLLGGTDRFLVETHGMKLRVLTSS